MFCEALYGMEEPIESGTESPTLVGFQVSKLLSDSHAFEAGDTRAVEWIDGERPRPALNETRQP